MRIRTQAVLAYGALSALLACGSSKDPLWPDELDPGTATLTAGCYTLTLGSWSEAGATTPPDAFQLTDEPSQEGAETRRIQPLPGRPSWSYMSALWTPTGDLAFSGGYTGVRISLAGDESPFPGQAEAWSDAIVIGRQWPRAAATLERIPCPE